MTQSLHDTGHDMGVRFGDSSRLNNPTNFTYGFKTRDGSVGVLQVTGFTETPPGLKIRYKLVPTTVPDEAGPEAGISTEADNVTRETLNERLEAASSMNDVSGKDQPLAAVAIDAAKMGLVEIARKSLTQMYDPKKRDENTEEVVRLLAKSGSRKQAIEMAKGINDYTIRDRTLAELAQ